MTAGYSNVNNFIVILADDRDPWVSWQNHLKRGSAGGVDVVAAVGRPLYAPADCYIANTKWNGTAGHTVTMSFSDGWRDQFLHLSAFATPGSKKKGQLVGYSGRTASGSTTGVAPHVHWHRIDPQGRRQNPWNYFTDSDTAGGGTTPIENDDMSAEAEQKIDWIHQMIAYGGTVGGKGYNYGVLPIVAHNQTLINSLSGQIAALAKAVQSLSGGEDIDLAAIEQAAREGAASAAALSDEDKAQIANSIAAAVVAQLDDVTGLTKADVIEALKSVTWVAE
jgi:hypothetical protein